MNAREILQGLGLETHVLWEVPPEEKGLSASEVREGLIRGEPWEFMVPPPVSVLMKTWGVSERLRALRGRG